MTWYSAEPYLPHRRRMRLIDMISDEGTVTARAQVRLDNPFLEAGQLPAHAGIEYMAQAIAGRANLLHGLDAPRRGVISVIDSVQVHRAYLSLDADILIETEQVLASGAHSVNRCRVLQDGDVISAVISTKEVDD